MSTEYTIATSEGGEVELSIYEHSGHLDIDMSSSHLDKVISLVDLTPHEVSVIALKMLESASYVADYPEVYLEQIGKILVNQGYSNPQ